MRADQGNCQEFKSVKDRPELKNAKPSKHGGTEEAEEGEDRRNCRYRAESP
jgi:hypothetical protein